MANCYIINYDLRNSRDYNGLYEAIKSYGTYAKVLESCWAIVTTQSATQVRDFLLRSMDSDDGIFVVKSGGEAAWQRVLCTDEWLKRNL
ncbi:CRISPR-associated protein Cas2 [uncultured Roseivirga sp.]|uniref:CRISPR-associated protein Cas2 n=1 Tax=uncultured Roseivirga sp. TaxID=543088 RepID=UPI0030DCE959|tara:strand:- start:113952 stop:114218 length:267 start_codon:yes stop_codon:yes gene_type:complete